jgi:hypothetical protein
MFDLAFNLLQAYDKIMLIVAGVVCALIGILILMYPLYVSYGARRYRGEVIGLRQDDKGGNRLLWPVIAYTDDDGQRHEALASAGSSVISAVPGMPMSILVKPGQPDRCASTGFGWIELIGAACLVPGILLIRSGLKDFPVNWLSMLVLLGILAYLGRNVFRWVRPLLALRHLAEGQVQGFTMSRQPLEDRQRWPLLPPGEITERVTAQDAKARRWVPFLCLVGVALTIGGAGWGQHRMIFIASAGIAQGTVIGNERADGSGSSGPTYHAIVRFADAGGNAVRYRDEIGSNPPSFRVGETVRVYYDPQRPESALIDRGLWNWLLPLLVSLGGLLLFVASLAQYRSIRRRAPYVRPAPAIAGA